MPWVDMDTTSDFFQKGNMKFNNALKKDTSFKETAKCFKEPDASQGVFVIAGERFLVAVDSPNEWQGDLSDLSLDIFRYNKFTR